MEKETTEEKKPVDIEIQLIRINGKISNQIEDPTRIETINENNQKGERQQKNQKEERQSIIRIKRKRDNQTKES